MVLKLAGVMTVGLGVGALIASKGARVLDEDLGWFHYEPDDDDGGDDDDDDDDDDDKDSDKYGGADRGGDRAGSEAAAAEAAQAAQLSSLSQLLRPGLTQGTACIRSLAFSPLRLRAHNVVRRASFVLMSWQRSACT